VRDSSPYQLRTAEFAVQRGSHSNRTMEYCSAPRSGRPNFGSRRRSTSEGADDRRGGRRWAYPGRPVPDQLSAVEDTPAQTVGVPAEGIETWLAEAVVELETLWLWVSELAVLACAPPPRTGESAFQLLTASRADALLGLGQSTLHQMTFPTVNQPAARSAMPTLSGPRNLAAMPALVGFESVRDTWRASSHGALTLMRRRSNLWLSTTKNRSAPGT
jgi:hypothetical protein